jgi:hypothetical protein
MDWEAVTDGSSLPFRGRHTMAVVASPSAVFPAATLPPSPLASRLLRRHRCRLPRHQHPVPGLVMRIGHACRGNRVKSTFFGRTKTWKIVPAGHREIALPPRNPLENQR